MTFFSPSSIEHDLLPRQPHHQRAVGVVLADIVELERGPAERYVALAVDDLVGDDNVNGLERLDTGLGILVRDKGRAEVLERLATGDVVEMAVAVDDVFDRRLGDGLDRVDIGLRRPPLADRVGGDHAVRCDDEHRLMTAIAEDIDVVRDLGGGEWRRSRLLRLRGCGKHDGDDCSGHTRKVNSQHVRFLPGALKRAERNFLARALQMQQGLRRLTNAPSQGQVGSKPPNSLTQKPLPARQHTSKTRHQKSKHLRSRCS
jgi:hypothetical protein